ncbi:hypothetical protein GIB67_026264, partial [Kingdonia uniflora]
LSLSLNLFHSKFKFYYLSFSFPPLNHSVSLNPKLKFQLNSHTLSIYLRLRLVDDILTSTNKYNIPTSTNRELRVGGRPHGRRVV